MKALLASQAKLQQQLEELHRVDLGGRAAPPSSPKSPKRNASPAGGSEAERKQRMKVCTPSMLLVRGAHRGDNLAVLGVGCLLTVTGVWQEKVAAKAKAKAEAKAEAKKVQAQAGDDPAPDTEAGSSTPASPAAPSAPAVPTTPATPATPSDTTISNQSPVSPGADESKEEKAARRKEEMKAKLKAQAMARVKAKNGDSQFATPSPPDTAAPSDNSTAPETETGAPATLSSENRRAALKVWVYLIVCRFRLIVCRFRVLDGADHV